MAKFSPQIFDQRSKTLVDNLALSSGITKCHRNAPNRVNMLHPRMKRNAAYSEEIAPGIF
jgi:hypothetical protein